MSTTGWLLVLVAYLLGSISFSYLIVRVLTGRDVRSVGSGNAGATNTMRAAGSRAALATLVLDIGKGVLPVVVARALQLTSLEVVLVAAAAVLGHVYPVFLRFQGGKGVATAAGALGAVAPLALLSSLVVFAVTLAWRRWVSLSSISAVVAFPFFVWIGGRLGIGEAQPREFFLGATVIPALIVWKHRSNLKRILAGTEPRIGEKKSAGAEP